MSRKRVAVSSRVSRVAGREGDSFGSPDVQENLCKDYCKRKKWEVKLLLRELDVSGGTEMHHRELEQAIKMIEAKELDGIVVAKIDRFSRDMLNGLLSIDRIHKAGGFIVAVDDGIDTSEEGGSMGKLWLYILLAFADWYRLQRAEGFETVKARAVERGVHISGTVPTGYTKSATGVLEVNHEVGEMISQAFIMRAEGASIGHVSRFLEMTTTQASRLLKNRVYLGEARQGKHVNPEAHPALVDPRVFDIVQSQFRRADPADSRQTRHLLAGVARCASCGYALERQKTGGRYYTYRCRRKSANGECAAPAMIMADALETYASEKLLERIDTQAAFEPVADDGVIADIHIRLEAERAKRLPFEDPEYVGVIGVAAAKRACAKVDAKIEALEDELAATVGSHQQAPWPARSVIGLWEEMNSSEKREILAGEIESVMVARVPRGTPIADRVVVHFRRDETAPARPSRGRRKTNEAEVEAGVTAA